MQQNMNIHDCGAHLRLICASHIVIPEADGTFMPCPHCNLTDIPSAAPATPVKAPQGEPKCPGAPKKPPVQRRGDIQPIPISPALRFDAPANWCNKCHVARDIGDRFCGKCGDGLVVRPPARKYTCKVCNGNFERETDDKFCAYCSSILETPVQNYPLALIEFEHTFNYDLVIAAEFGPRVVRAVLLAGYKTVGMYRFGSNLENGSPDWRDADWTAHFAAGPDQTVRGLRPAKIRVDANGRAVLHMKM